MIRSSIPPSAYIDQTWFEKERALFFEPLWQFATLKTLFKEVNSYVALELLGREIVIQNFNGKLCAFENTCLHRQNRLQERGVGHRPLVCKYHGWAYGPSGEVSHIPFEQEYYQFEPNEIGCLHLKQYTLKILGNLVFIALSDRTIDFDLQFSRELQDKLTDLSESFDDETLFTCLPIKANWKLSYENLRDSIHPRFLHQKSISKYVKFETRINPDWIQYAKKYIDANQSKQEFLDALKSFSWGGLIDPLINPISFPWHEFVKRYGVDDWYLNWLIFPNFHISSGSGGYSFIIEHHRPISAGETELALYICTAKKRRKYKYSPAVLFAHLEGALKTLREDFAIVEDIQSVLRPDSDQSINGVFELGNSIISKWYMDVMDGNHEI